MAELGKSIFVSTLCKCVTLVMPSQVIPSQLLWLRLLVEALLSSQSLAPLHACLRLASGQGRRGDAPAAILVAVSYGSVM